MKKSLFIMIIGMIFSIGVWIGGTVWIDQGKEQVEVIESVLYGEVEKAKGISLRIDTQWEEKLFWSTSYSVGTLDQPKTTFQVQNRNKKMGGFWKTEEIVLEMDMPAWFVTEGREGISLEGLPYAEIFRDVAGRTEAGEERTEEVYLADYYRIYPLRLEVQSEKISCMIIPEDAGERVTQFFQIPVLPEHRGKVSVRKNEKGEVIRVQYENLEGELWIRTSGVVSDTGCYFSFVCYQGERMLDTLKIESGMYVLPFYWEMEEGQETAVMEYEKLTCMYPLEAQTAVLGLQEEEKDGERFLIIVKEKEKLVLFVIEKETGVLLQRMEVAEWEEGDMFQSLEQQENQLLITMEDGAICFLVKDQMGYYQKKVEGNFDRIEKLWERNMLVLGHSFQWDGKRLAVAGFPYNQQNSVYLAVFEEEGMVFLGFYQHSGDLDWKLGLEGIRNPIRSVGKPVLEIR
ncbi:MAG: hypothetical protein OSJ62_07000 [Lachnospiraceae bacterium]|nr:hypothetical protein [Lachnospiraceae bacterium]